MDYRVIVFWTSDLNPRFSGHIRSNKWSNTLLTTDCCHVIDVSDIQNIYLVIWQWSEVKVLDRPLAVLFCVVLILVFQSRSRTSSSHIHVYVCEFGQGCHVHAIATNAGALTAQGRSSLLEETGFSFVNCKVTGSGALYLGRAWGPFSRVVFAYTYMDNIITPKGWYNWGDPNREMYATLSLSFPPSIYVVYARKRYCFRIFNRNFSFLEFGHP